MMRRFTSLLLLGLLLPHGGAGQTQTFTGPIPFELQEETFLALNDPSLLRIVGNGRIPEGIRVEGDLGVIGGNLELAGAVSGSVTVLNGDLRLLPGGRIEGGLLIIGGRLLGDAGGAVGGGTRIYPRALGYRLTENRIESAAGAGDGRGILASDLGFGEIRLGVRVAGAYNRVEGLPVLFGPILRTGGSNPLTLRASGIWRSTSGLTLSTDKLGYSFALQQEVGGRGVAALALAAFDQVTPIESAGLSDLEASLATFLLHRDYRDHVERREWRAGLILRTPRQPLRTEISYRVGDDRTPPLRSPWSLRGEDPPWRPLPLIAHGRMRSLSLELQWDTRNDRLHPSGGSFLTVEFQRQIAGSLQLPPSTPEGTTIAMAGQRLLEPFTRGSVDLRHYARIGPTAQIRIRGFAGGSLGDAALPPQFQHALGGEGSLPGHRPFSLDCGARSLRHLANTGSEGPEGRAENPVYLAYGCDQVALVQVELQSTLPFTLDLLPDRWSRNEILSLLRLEPTWVLFFNAAQGWAKDPLVEGVPRPNSPTRADLGVGLFAGPLGIYWGYPLHGPEQRLNFFVRLQQRF